MIAKLQTKSSFSRTGQNREFAQFEALEKRLERWAMPKIRKEMNVIARDILTNYQLGGVARVNAISIPDGVARLEETLLPIYQRSIDNSIKILKKQNPDVNFDDLKKDLEQTYRAQAKTAAQQISRGTSNEVQRVVDKANADGLSHQDTQKQLRKKLRRSNSVRSRVISETEIGAVTAESVDSTYKQYAPGAVVKVWVTRRDSKVRDPHQDAEGQTVHKEENFIVDGEELPYPRYRGASPGNRINCRCRVRWEKV